MQVKPLGPTALAAVDGRRHALIGRGQGGDAWLRHVGMPRFSGATRPLWPRKGDLLVMASS